MMGLSVMKAFHIAIAKCVLAVRCRNSRSAPVENSGHVIYRIASSI
jgi:hypothetical protein